MPELKLGDYKSVVKKIKPEDNQDKKVEEIYQSLLKSTKIDISPVLVEQEAGYSMERLENHAKSLNLSLEKYFEALKKTKEEVDKEYQQKAEESIKLDLILLEVAKNEKIETSESEINELAKLSNIPADQKNQLQSILTRRKTIDFLLKI
jgi:trigger factor